MRLIVIKKIKIYRKCLPRTKPLNPRNLDRLAMRAMMGLARTGSHASNGSGDYVIAFSTDSDVRKPRSSILPVTSPTLVNSSMSPLFAATTEATEEAIYNAIFKATTVSSDRGSRQAIPLDDLMQILSVKDYMTATAPNGTNINLKMIYISKKV